MTIYPNPEFHTRDIVKLLSERHGIDIWYDGSVSSYTSITAQSEKYENVKAVKKTMRRLARGKPKFEIEQQWLEKLYPWPLNFHSPIGCDDI